RLSCRVLPLLAIDETDRLSLSRLRELLETSEVLARRLFITRQLVGPRQPELGGEVLRVQLQAAQIGANSLIVARSLRVQLPKKIKRVGVVRINARYPFKSVDSKIRLSKVSIENAEVIPGTCALRLASRRIEQNFACFIIALSVE